MRIDKFLWHTRLFKTRSIATEACKKNAVWVDGDLAKPSKEVMTGQHIKFRKNGIYYEYNIIGLPKNRVGAKLVSLFIVDKTPAEQIQALENRKLDQDYYRQKGLGRPTKRDRRDLDDFFETDEV